MPALQHDDVESRGTSLGGSHPVAVLNLCRGTLTVTVTMAVKVTVMVMATVTVRMTVTVPMTVTVTVTVIVGDRDGADKEDGDNDSGDDVKDMLYLVEDLGIGHAGVGDAPKGDQLREKDPETPHV